MPVCSLRDVLFSIMQSMQCLGTKAAGTSVGARWHQALKPLEPQAQHAQQDNK